jgi:hypothetical protein
MNSETLTILLRGEHLNMPERIKRGLWPHPPLRFSDLVVHLSRVLESEKWFPREWKPAVPGESVWEGGVIEHQSSSRYVYRTQRHQPINPAVLAEQTEEVFSSAEDAARYYLKWDLNLPGDLDGWKVVA